MILTALLALSAMLKKTHSLAEVCLAQTGLSPELCVGLLADICDNPACMYLLPHSCYMTFE